MAQTSLIVNHDYLTVRVKFTKDSRINLTINHWGPKLSATMDLVPAFDAVGNAFEKAWKAKKFGDNGKFMAAVKDAATAAADVADLTARLNAIAA